MTLETEKALKPLNKLRKLLKRFPEAPRPQQVHKLRTATRRLEASLEALSFAPHETRHLLKLTATVRKAAGKVRDMDVLMEHVLSLHRHGSGDSLICLLESLARKRASRTGKLNKSVAHNGDEIRDALKHYEKRMRHALRDHASQIEAPLAPAQILAAQLGHWPKLTARNLHPFRVRVKELRYMLELRTNTRGMHLDELGKVKDLAGEWHDWVELAHIAGDVLNPERDNQLLRAIAQTEREKLTRALAAANALRAHAARLPLAA